VKSLRLKLSPDRVLLGIAFLIFSGSTIVWTLHDKTPPPWDPSDHLITAYDYYRPLAHGQVSQFGREFFFGTHYYAPLIHIVGSFFFLIFGASRLSGVAVNIVALGILLASTWWLGNSLYSAGGVGITKSSASGERRKLENRTETIFAVLRSGAIKVSRSVNNHAA